MNDPAPLFHYDPVTEHVVVQHKCTKRGYGDDGRVFRILPIVGAHKWTIESIEPLTVRPAVKCPHCDLHGYIAGGFWRRVE